MHFPSGHGAVPVPVGLVGAACGSRCRRSAASVWRMPGGPAPPGTRAPRTRASPITDAWLPCCRPAALRPRLDAVSALRVRRFCARTKCTRSLGASGVVVTGWCTACLCIDVACHAKARPGAIFLLPGTWSKKLLQLERSFFGASIKARLAPSQTTHSCCRGVVSLPSGGWRRRFGLSWGLRSHIRVGHITHVFRGPHTGHAQTEPKSHKGAISCLSADRYCLVAATAVLVSSAPAASCCRCTPAYYYADIIRCCTTTPSPPSPSPTSAAVCWIVLGEELCPLVSRSVKSRG